jgi:hypothetical protein
MRERTIRFAEDGNPHWREQVLVGGDVVNPDGRVGQHQSSAERVTRRADAQRRDVPETVPVVHETSERIVRALVVGVPAAGLVVAGWLAWGGTLHWQDLCVLAIMYTLSGMGVTVGFHRLFTHRSFKTTRTVRALLAVLGSTAVEGPVIEWVAPTESITASRTAQATPTARTSPEPRDGAARCAGSPTPTSDGCSAARTWPTRPAMRGTCSPTATCG